MRKLEIALKFCFVALAAALIWTRNIYDIGFITFLFVGLILGVVLIISKHPSYKRANKKRDFMMRRIEGALLIASIAAVIPFL